MSRCVLIQTATAVSIDNKHDGEEGPRVRLLRPILHSLLKVLMTDHSRFIEKSVDKTAPLSHARRSHFVKS